MSPSKTNLIIKVTKETKVTTQTAFIFPKPKTETPEHGANYAQSRQKSHQHDANCIVLVSLMHNRERTSHSAPVFPLPTLNMQLPAGYLPLELIL